MIFLWLLVSLTNLAKASYDASKVHEANLSGDIAHINKLDVAQKQFLQNDNDIVAAFSEYTGSEYKYYAQALLESTGTFLKKGESDLMCSSADKYLSTALRMNNAILNMPKLEEKLTVYRTLSFMTKKTGVFKKYQTVGNIVPITHFTSTSLKPDIGAAEYVLKIELPKDFPVRVLLTVSNYKSEKEILLPFTLDKTGRTANYGLRVDHIDAKHKKVYNANGSYMKMQKYIHVSVVDLSNPIVIDPDAIPCKGFRNFSQSKSLLAIESINESPAPTPGVNQGYVPTKVYQPLKYFTNYSPKKPNSVYPHYLNKWTPPAKPKMQDKPSKYKNDYKAWSEYEAKDDIYTFPEGKEKVVYKDIELKQNVKIGPTVKSSSSSNSALVYGIGITLIVIIFLAIIILVIRIRRKRARKSADATIVEGQKPNAGLTPIS